ncbi:MAG: TonB-dependent receptor [Rhodoferax sp.]
MFAAPQIPMAPWFTASPTLYRRRPHSARRRLLAACAALACGASAAQALDDVVVSASRSAQRSFDIPAAVQALDRDDIAHGGAQVNLSESLNRVPGLTLLNRQNYAQDLQLSVRGFGARAAFGIRGVRLLVDGIPATTPDGQGQASTVSLTSTERLEVLRGPMAQLYGNASGGVILATTRSAPDVPEFSASAFGGSFGLERTDWQYAGKLGGVGLVADYSTFQTDGFRANSSAQRKQFNGKISLSPRPDSQLEVVYNRFDMPLANDPLGLTQAQVQADPSQAGDNAISRRVRKTVLQNQLGATLHTRLDAQRSLNARLYTGTRDNLQYQAGVFGVTPTGAWVSLNRRFYGAGLQYQAQTRWGSVPVQWVVGYDYDRSSELRQAGAAAQGEKTTTDRNEDNQATNSDFYLQAQAGLSERWSLAAGLRRSSIRLDSEDHFLSDGNGSGAVDYGQTSPVLGLTFHATERLNLYASYGQGFESPTLAEVAYSGAGLNAFNTTLRAARSDHYELGMKWAPSARSRLDFAVYRIDSTDEVVVASSTGGKTTYKNAPGTQRTGWELSAQHLMGDSVRWRAAASQIDAVFSETFKTGATTVQGGNFIPGIPQFFVFGELAWSQHGFAGKSQRLGAQAALELTRAGRLYANDTNSASADGYTTLNLRASHGWAIGRATLTALLRVDNLSDQRYVGSVIVNQAGQRFYEPAPGRTVTAGVQLTLPL